MGRRRRTDPPPESEGETTQRHPHLADAIRALERAEAATAADRARVKYEPKDYPAHD